MDVRLFKLLILVLGESVFAGALLLLNKFGSTNSHVVEMFSHLVRYALMSFPLLLVLPEDNWIWLVEEDPRGRKITLRSKAAKHLHLSMLYFLLLGYPAFLVSISMITMREKYRFPPSWIIIGSGVAFGIYCAWRNFRNVKKYDSLFAVGWDRKAAFVEIFIGSRLAKNIKLFYKGWALLFGAVYFLGAAGATYIYYKWFAPLGAVDDREKFTVLMTVFCVMLSFSVWVMSMYVAFQLFFSRRVEAWVRQKNNNRGA